MPSCVSIHYAKGLCASHYRNCDPGQKEKFRAKARRYKRSEKGQKANKRYKCNLNGLYSRLKEGAVNRGLEFLLSKEDVDKTRSKPCHYCGDKIGPTSAGVDRIDNELGYLCSNILPACARCNMSRNKYFTVEEFKIMMEALLEHKRVKSIPNKG